MLYLVATIHVLVCVFLILVVLLQQGKGADLSVFGGGSTQTAFGARGATTLLHKITVVSFILFVVTTLGIGILQTKSSVMNAGAAGHKPAAVPVRPGQAPSPKAAPLPGRPAGAAVPVQGGTAAPTGAAVPAPSGAPKAPAATPAPPAAPVPKPSGGTGTPR